MLESEQNFWDVDVYVEHLKQQPSDRINATIAHDIGNRVGGVCGYADFLRKYFAGELPVSLSEDEILNMFEIISNNGKQIMNVLQALNQFESQQLPEDNHPNEPIESPIPQDDITHTSITSANDLLE